VPQDSASVETSSRQNEIKPAGDAAPTPRSSEMLLHGLPSKLLYLTALFIMLAEILIFVPSVANFRITWLTDRLTAARLASLAADAAPGGIIPESVRSELLSTAQLRSVAVKTSGMRKLVLPPEEPFVVDAQFDLREDLDATFSEWLANRFGLVADAIGVFFAPEGRMILVRGHPDPGFRSPLAQEDFVEIVLPEATLKAAMVRYGLNVLGLSIIISIIAAALVYITLIMMFVRPMMRLTRNMLSFSEDPEDASRIIVPSDRRDEIGIAERELARMQRQLSQTLQQKSRLAQLGLAVSKINHDLRNMLASAQIISDRLTAVPDPTVQRFAPKLIASLDRAINFCNDTLRYGRAEEAAPRRELIALRELVEEVGEGLGLPREGIDWSVLIEPKLRVDADPDHLFRILNNICRNAAQAIESQQPPAAGEIVVEARREGLRTIIEVRDNGPGVSAQARARLFQAFAGSSRNGGTGLGLAIAAELVRAHGGTIQLLEVPKGAAFRIEIPDRSRAKYS